MSKQKHILLTGGTGLIGTALTHQLLAQGYKVSHLSRVPGKNPPVTTFLWNVEKGEIAEDSIDGVDVIIHLAGAGVVDKRWTEKRKKVIIDSRTNSIALVYQLLKKKPNQVNAVISASATGYYGDRADELLIESSQPTRDFLSTVCIEWEQAADKGLTLNLRVVKLRTGVVLTKKGGALPQLALPVKFGAGSPLGTGKQWIPWIHLQDAVDMYIHAIENEKITDVYNMVAPNPVTNKQLTQAIAKQLHRPMWLPNVPKFALKLLLGEMSIAVLESAKASAEKIEHTGFVFKYPEITGALKEIYG